MSTYSEIVEQSVVLQNQLKSNNDYIMALNKNMEILISGYQLLLNIVQNHDNLLNNALDKEKGCNFSEPVMCMDNLNVGANEEVNDMINDMSNVDLEDNLCSELNTSVINSPGILHETVFNVIPIENLPQINVYSDLTRASIKNAKRTFSFDDISSIDSNILDLINPDFAKINLQSTKLSKNNTSNEKTGDKETSDDDVNDDGTSISQVSMSETYDVESTCGSNKTFSVYEGFHHTPYELHHKSNFSLFKVNELDKSTEFSTHFDNRSVAFYGEFPYSYSNTSHEPQPFTNNGYLGKLLSYVEVVYPNAKFNSAMVHRYCTGQNHIPMHSDSEADIVDGSSIITISLGDTRVMSFQEKDSSYMSSVSLQHGDSLIMTKSSQKYFCHGILPEDDKSLRISVTLRLLNPPNTANFLETRNLSTNSRQQPALQSKNPVLTKAYNDIIEQDNVKNRQFFTNQKKTFENSTRPVTTIYISSSMFRFLNPYKMSSNQQNAQVFFYPGANAEQMMKRLFQDPIFRAIDRKSVKQIFILSGTNNVDAILAGSQTISSVSKHLSELLGRVWTHFDHPKIHVVNILPREHQEKNDIVQQLNQFLYNECQAHGIKFVNTESGPDPMFSHSNEHRNNNLFANGFDNVHLNELGYAKLARHLKYLAHYR